MYCSAALLREPQISYTNPSGYTTTSFTTYTNTVTQRQCCWQSLKTLTWKDLLTVELNAVSAEANIISVPTNISCWVQGTVHSWADISCGCRRRASAKCWGTIVTQASDRIKKLAHSTSKQMCPSILWDRQVNKVWVSLTSRLTNYRAGRQASKKTKKQTM